MVAVAVVLCWMNTTHHTSYTSIYSHHTDDRDCLTPRFYILSVCHWSVFVCVLRDRANLLEITYLAGWPRISREAPRKQHRNRDDKPPIANAFHVYLYRCVGTWIIYMLVYYSRAIFHHTPYDDRLYLGKARAVDQSNRILAGIFFLFLSMLYLVDPVGIVWVCKIAQINDLCCNQDIHVYTNPIVVSHISQTICI